ncbi:unnamed protein product [Paramecium pentaurelia]|uniref:Coenzyme Q-binding protein COQ10 START domain-containing protein n=1 Tax=Paramecium pentaurelia TaxID=43138 RepID=A0A8S1SZY1_9CILI|nr:unnamed protein product [Paramecium pentaurelia]
MLNFIKHQQTTFIKVPTKFMFEIVKNVDAYYQFLPGCSQSKTFNHKSNYFEGELEVDYKLFKSSYISKVFIQQHPQFYTITSISENNAVFKMLKSIWELKGDEKQCQANYSIEFQFKNPLFQHASSLFLKEIVNSTSNAFEQRAYTMFQEQQKNQSHQENRDGNTHIDSEKNRNQDPLNRLISKKLIDEQQLNLVLRNQEILNLIKQMQNLYQDQNQADQKCVEFIKEYLLLQQFKI